MKQHCISLVSIIVTSLRLLLEYHAIIYNIQKQFTYQTIRQISN